MRTTLMLTTLLIAGCETGRDPAQSWEYTSVSGNFTTARIGAVLEAKSGTDWELVAVPVLQNNDAMVIFKRPAVAEGQ